MRKISAIALAIASVILCAAGVGAAPPLVKLGTVAPDGSSWHQILKEMGERWRQAPGGGLTLSIYAGGVL